MSKHSSKRPTPNKRRPARTSAARWLWVGAGLLGLVVVVGAAFFWPRAGGAPQLSAARLASDPTLGPAGAPITLVEYGDFG